jgi:hypothetical protein
MMPKVFGAALMLKPQLKLDVTRQISAHRGSGA